MTPSSDFIAAHALPTRRLGKTGPDVSVISLGGVGLGGKATGDLYGGITDEQAIATVHRAVERGINFIDTSPLYQESERRIGLALEALSPEQWQHVKVGTKVGDDCPPYSDNGGHSPFSKEGVLCSVRHSLKMLRVVNVLETVLVHDPTLAELDQFFAPNGGAEALLQLQADGVVRHVGIGCVEPEVHRAFLAKAPAQLCGVLLTVNDHNLLRRHAAPGSGGHESWAEAASKGVGILNAGAFYMGLLADARASWQQGFKVSLQQEALRALAAEMSDWCMARGVALRTLALQFAAAHELVGSVPIGCRSTQEVDEIVASMLEPVPEQLCAEFHTAFDARVAALGRDDHWYYDKRSSRIGE